MYRQFPEADKICCRRYRERDRQIHEKKLKNMKPSIRTTFPEYTVRNLKGEQQMKERYNEIVRNNTILFKKMNEIMKKPTFSLVRQRPGGNMSSLNHVYRKWRLEAITRENMAILRRLQGVKPVLSHLEWIRHEKEHAQYLKNIREYPYISSRKLLSPRQKKPTTTDLTQRQQRIAKWGAALTSRKLRQKTAAEPSVLRKEDIDTIDPSVETLPVIPRRVLFKDGRSIGDAYYLLEITCTQNETVLNIDDDLRIVAYDGETQETLRLDIDRENHHRLLRHFQDDYRKLADKLSIVEGHFQDRDGEAGKVKSLVINGVDLCLGVRDCQEDEQQAEVVEAEKEEKRDANLEGTPEGETMKDDTEFQEAEAMKDDTEHLEVQAMKEDNKLQEAKAMKEDNKLQEAKAMTEDTKLQEAEAMKEDTKLQEAEAMKEVPKLQRSTTHSYYGKHEIVTIQNSNSGDPTFIVVKDALHDKKVQNAVDNKKDRKKCPLVCPFLRSREASPSK